jgi:DNA-binding NtrC family response regulator
MKNKLDCAGKILVVDDAPDNLRLLLALLKNAGFEVLTAINGEMALAAASEAGPDLILLDILLPDMKGYEVCKRLKGNPQTADIPILFISGLGDSIDKLHAFSAGGVDYICKPFQSEEVLARVQTHLSLRRALQTVQEQKDSLVQEKCEREKTEHELNKYQTQVAGILSGQLLNPKAFKHIVTKCEKIHGLFRYIEALSCSSEPVLLLGESGVGKELFAKSVHTVCNPHGPWIAVNIAGFDDNVFSDTLFGHIKGAFTDASHERAGMIEKATDGVLFLDEIGDLSLASQVKLLRLLQEKEYFPLGSDESREANCRIVMATNVDLKKRVDDGSFRRDLYFRLTTHMLEIPPLRERREDVSLLLDHFLTQSAEEFGKKKPSYPAELLVLLNNYSFPGNVREFRSMVFDAMSRHQSQMLSMSSFVSYITDTDSDFAVGGPNGAVGDIIFPDKLPTLKGTSDLLIAEALRRTEGNQSMAAKLLGITSSALNMRLKKKNAP